MYNVLKWIISPGLALCLYTPGNTAQADDITIAAANSTCSTIKTVGDSYTQNRPIKINYICKSSGLLAKGIRGGSIQADIYISANKHWMDYMVKGGLIAADKVVSPWGNRLVVSVPVGSPLQLEAWHDLASDRIKNILIGDPGTAPFGRYAKQALQRTGIWEQVKHKITTTKHITLLAEILEQSDNATVGILFSTNTTKRLKPVLLVDTAWHPDINYYLAPVRQATDNPAVAGLFDYIRGATGVKIFEAAGFNVNPQ